MSPLTLSPDDYRRLAKVIRTLAPTAARPLLVRLGLLRGAASLHQEKMSSATLLQRAEAWRPWRAYAAQHLWAADSNSAPTAKTQRAS